MPDQQYAPRHASIPPLPARPRQRWSERLSALRPKTFGMRHAAVAVVVAGAVLFAVGESLTGAAIANRPAAGQPKSPAPPAADAQAGTLQQLLQRLTVGSPADRVTLGAAPTHVTTPAPASHAVISDLAANGIPAVALNAYRVAAARLAHTDPACGIDWALLAGIGREESDHGLFAGAVLNADGTSTPRIIGPALDGVRWDYIPAPPDGLQLDGDAVYAHALGPMQFIPSTWAGYGADANGDGVADVFNINDAALGAARYLCAAGGNLRTLAGQSAAVLAYNHSDQYLAQVLALANAYRTGIAVTGIPIGDVTGPLPPVNGSGYLPPVNPGGPTAATFALANKSATRPATGTSAAAGSPSSTSSSGTTRPATGGSGGGTASTGSQAAASTAPAPAPTAGNGGPTGTAGPSTPALPAPAPVPIPVPAPSPLCVIQLTGKCL